MHRTRPTLAAESHRRAATTGMLHRRPPREKSKTDFYEVRFGRETGSLHPRRAHRVRHRVFVGRCASLGAFQSLRSTVALIMP